MMMHDVNCRVASAVRQMQQDLKNAAIRTASWSGAGRWLPTEDLATSGKRTLRCLPNEPPGLPGPGLQRIKDFQMFFSGNVGKA